MNLAELILERARTAGGTPAVRMGSESLSYAELARESERVATGLRALGVARGQRVMMFSENNIEYLVTYLATARLGAVFAPVHASFQGTELEYVVANCTPTAIVAQSGLWERLEMYCGDQLPAIRIVIDGSWRGTVSYDGLGRNTTADVGVEAVADDDPVLICYTSGTTDRPHPVTRSHRHEIWNATTYADVWDYRAGDRALVTMPLSWVWGLCTLSQGLLAAGATIILHDEFDPRAVLEDIEASRISLFAGTMSMYTALLRALDERTYDLSSIRRLYRGGELINREVVSAIEARTGVRLIEAYSTSEATPILAIDPVRDVDAPRGSAGRLVPGARISLVDDDGVPVPRGEVGEAWLGGPGVMLGYWNEPELTAARLTSDGWFRSGDLLVEGDRGYYSVVGRTADVIIRNGAKIAAAEVEAALNGLPGVRDSVAVGVPDEEFGESIVAFVQLDPGCIVSIDDIFAQLSGRIARFKLPGEITFVEELPVHRNHKRDRASVRRRAMAEVESDVGQSDITGPPAGGPVVVIPLGGNEHGRRLRLVE